MMESNAIVYAENKKPEEIPFILSKKKSTSKLQKALIGLRRAGRIVAPLNDAAVGFWLAYELLGLINNLDPKLDWFHYADYTTPTLHIVMLVSASLSMISSAAFEIINSCSTKGTYLIGDSDYNHIVKLVEGLADKLKIDSIPDNVYENLDKWIATLTPQQQQTVKPLVTDFKRVNRYNRVKRAIGDFANLIFSIIIFEEILSGCSLLDSKWIDSIGIVLPIYLLKVAMNLIERRWDRFQNSWDRLPLYAQKIMIGFRSLINKSFDFITAGFFVAYLANGIYLGTGGGNHNPIYYDISFCILDYLSTAAQWSIIAAAGAIYTGIQLLPETNPARHRKIKNIKQITKGIVDGGILLLLLVQASIMASYNEPLLWLLLLSLILPTSLITTLNSILNANRPDDRKMTTLKKELHLQSSESSHLIVPVNNYQTIVQPNKKKITSKSRSAWCCFWNETENETQKTNTRIEEIQENEINISSNILATV